ncbi:MAG: hypothetical protein RL479_2403, partial [Verrucomicrobiota bacterium]
MKNPALPAVSALARNPRVRAPLTCLLAGALLGGLPLALDAASPVKPSFPAPASIRWAEQGWNAAERENWHHRSAGQAFGPLSWVQAVEQPATERRLMEPDNLRELGFLTKEASFANPWALPVGFVLTAGAPGQRLQVGLTCAACHTGQVERGGRALRIDGAPATLDDLTHVALVNYGAYTSFRVEQGGVRGLDLHLARLEAEAVELFGAPPGDSHLRGLMRSAVGGREACWLRVSLFSPEISPRTPDWQGVPRV